MIETQAVNLWDLKSYRRFFLGFRRVSSLDWDGSPVLVNPNVVMGEAINDLHYRMGRALVFATHRLTPALPYEFCIGVWMGEAMFPPTFTTVPAREGI